ncbi:GIY-YIG nuclease family protein [Myxococcus xanthus]|uniref:GIY-YIG nuclease family protein n=1 Tax=Myxococcus xanthus TaxID=34 RepID=UPI001CED6AAB|nr:GIY-YIG nuclease family protein [Myxococcus xanthus]
MREEEAAQRELERARLEAEREARRDEEALRKARTEFEKSTGAQQQKLQERIAELERRLAEDLDRQRAISQAQLTRTGHVYVISNIGSFGEDVYKVGMTRRLVPMDRIDELGDASVPFEFDVHAIIRTHDAPKLESELHRTFANRRINRINERKEFFRVSLDEIAEAVRKHHGDFELTRVAEAAEYRKSLALIDEERNGAETPTASAVA